jgi:hypothetical protein
MGHSHRRRRLPRAGGRIRAHRHLPDPRWWQCGPDEAVGVDGALQKLTDQTFGPLLLAVVAAGLFAYGLLYFVRAAYREV